MEARLNMAEIEISIFERGCLSKRVKSLDHLWQQIVTLATERKFATSAYPLALYLR